MIASHTIDEISPGKSHTTLRFLFTGLLGAPIGLLFRSVIERYLLQELASLELVVEVRQ